MRGEQTGGGLASRGCGVLQPRNQPAELTGSMGAVAASAGSCFRQFCMTYTMQVRASVGDVSAREL